RRTGDCGDGGPAAGRGRPKFRHRFQDGPRSGKRQRCPELASGADAGLCGRAPNDLPWPRGSCGASLHRGSKTDRRHGLRAGPRAPIFRVNPAGDSPAMATKTVTDQSFANDVLGADGAVLVDFWAEWCGPCRMIAPALEEIANDLGDKVTVAKLNIDENPDTPGRYGVRGIPTMLLFRGGQPVAQKVGAAPRSQIQQWLESNLDVSSQSSAG